MRAGPRQPIGQDGCRERASGLPRQNAGFQGSGQGLPYQLETVAVWSDHTGRLSERSARQTGRGAPPSQPTGWPRRGAPGRGRTLSGAELAQYSALILRAQVAYDRGDYDEAFRLLVRVRPGDSWRLVARSVLLSQGHERYLWGQVLAALAVRKR